MVKAVIQKTLALHILDTVKSDSDGTQQWTLLPASFRLLLYALATSKVISGWVPPCDSAHSWRPYNVASLGYQATGTISVGSAILLGHIIPTLNQPVLALS